MVSEIDFIPVTYKSSILHSVLLFQFLPTELVIMESHDSKHEGFVGFMCLLRSYSTIKYNHNFSLVLS